MAGRSRSVYLGVGRAGGGGLRSRSGVPNARILMMKTMAAFSVLVLSLVGLPAMSQDGSKSLRIYWIDVEGGAATLVVTPEGGSLLMDCGWPGTRDADRIAATAKAAGLQ